MHVCARVCTHTLLFIIVTITRVVHFVIFYFEYPTMYHRSVIYQFFLSIFTSSNALKDDRAFLSPSFVCPKFRSQRFTSPCAARQCPKRIFGRPPECLLLMSHSPQSNPSQPFFSSSTLFLSSDTSYASSRHTLLTSASLLSSLSHPFSGCFCPAHDHRII